LMPVKEFEEMDEKLDFSLPQKESRGPIVNKLIVVLLLVLTALGVANLIVDASSDGASPKVSASDLSAGQTKQLATRLAQRNLHAEAAKVWQDYLAWAGLTSAERAKALFQAGLALEKAGQYGEAIEYYYRSETVAALEELAPEINAHVGDCFEKLGKFSALRYELMDRTGMDKSAAAGADVVAQIDAEKITLSDLDAMIENAIENQLSPMAAFLTAEQLNEQKKKALDQFKNPQARQQFLQGHLAQEILYREALEEHLSQKPQVKQLLDEVMRSILGQQMMNEHLASKINITQTDIETYYAANKDKFIEPPKATISHILVEDEQEAADLIKRLKDGEDFAALAKEHSKDDGTKNTGGKIDADVTKDAHIPVIGDANGLNDQIFSVDAPALLEKPFKTEKGWEIVRVDTKRPQRQKSFDEVAQQVMMMLTNQKRQDIQQSYIKQMMDKYNVIIHTSVLTPSQEAQAEGGRSGPQK